MDRMQKQRRTNLIIDISLWLVVLVVFLMVRVNLMRVISPFIYALVLAYLLNPAVNFLEKKKIHRIIGILILFIIIALVFSGIGMTFIPRLAQDISVLVQDIPDLVDFVQRFFVDFRAGELTFLPDFIFDFIDIDDELQRLTQLLRDSFDSLYSFLIASTGTLLDLVMTPIITFYYLKDKKRLTGNLTKIFSPRIRSEVRVVARDINKVLGGFIRGQLIVAAFVGILTGAGCWVIGVPYALTIGVVAGLTNIIPYFGPFIGGILPVVLALMERPLMALWVVIWIVVVQQVESSLISPQVLAHSVGMHPLLVIFSVLFFGSLMGVAGMIIGVPLTATIKVLVRYVLIYRQRYRSKILTDS